MKGICKPKDSGVYVIGDAFKKVTLGIYRRQRWEFADSGRGRICLHYKFVTMYITSLAFEEDWEIIKVDEKEAVET